VSQRLGRAVGAGRGVARPTQRRQACGIDRKPTARTPGAGDACRLSYTSDAASRRHIEGIAPRDGAVGSSPRAGVGGVSSCIWTLPVIEISSLIIGGVRWELNGAGGAG
jgi:hypothetical protein